MNLLLVDDDERIVRFIKRGLEAEGYQVDVAREVKKGWSMAGATIVSLSWTFSFP